MDYMIEYWKGKETNPIEFLSHFRCTTEPIGGGTEYDADGELVSYDAAVAVIDVAKKDLINNACKWLEKKIDPAGVGRSQVVLFYDCIEDFKKAMEE